MTLHLAATLLALVGVLGLAGACLLASPVATAISAAQLVGALGAWLLAEGVRP